MLTLYHAAHTCSLASHIALEDAGAKYELKRIDFGRTEQQSPACLKINPKVRVPAMVTPRGVLTEAPAKSTRTTPCRQSRELAPHHLQQPRPDESVVVAPPGVD